MNASLFVGATFAAIEKDFENVYHAARAASEERVVG